MNRWLGGGCRSRHPEPLHDAYGSPCLFLVLVVIGAYGSYPLMRVFFAWAVYLVFSLPMLEFPTRHTIDGWIPERWVTNKRLWHVVVMTARHHGVLFGSCCVVASFVREHAGSHWHHWRVHGLVYNPSDQPSPSLLLRVHNLSCCCCVLLHFFSIFVMICQGNVLC